MLLLFLFFININPAKNNIGRTVINPYTSVFWIFEKKFNKTNKIPPRIK